MGLTPLAAVLSFTLALQDPAPPQGLHGRILDPHGRTVAGATVLVLRGDKIVVRVVTPEGIIEPIPLAPGDYQVIVSAAGFRAAIEFVHITIDSPDLELTVPLALDAVTEVVVVSASNVDEVLSRVPDSVTVINRDELLARQLNTLADVLRAVPGLSLSARGGPGAATDVFPRGGMSDYTLVLVDGVPQNRFGGGIDPARIGVSDLDRIEVIRGPQSALYGGGGIGAIVQLVTRHGGPFRFDTTAELGNHGTERAMASAAGSGGEWSWGAAAEGLTTNGASGAPLPGSAVRVANDGYQRLNGSASAGWSDRPGRVLRFDARAGRHLRGLPGPFGTDPLGLFPGIDLLSRTNDRTSTMSVSGVMAGAPRIRHRFLLGRVDDREKRTNRQGVVFEDRTRRITASYELAADERLLGLSFGTFLEHERADDNSIVAGEEVAPIARLYSGVFGEIRLSFQERLMVAAGVRAERIERSALAADEAAPLSRASMPTDVDWFALPKISAGWFVRRATQDGWTKLRAAAGTGVKPPTARQIANAYRPDLQPERNRSVDAGIEHAMFSHRLLVDANWFHNHYDDLIFAIATPAPLEGRYRTDNIARARSTGVELGATWRGRGGLSADLAFTWLRTRIADVDPSHEVAIPPYRVGDRLVRQPARHGLVGVTWTTRRGRLFATVSGRSPMRDLEPNAALVVFDNPGYVTLATGGSVFVHPHFELFVHATNALNRRYEEVLGYPALSRSVQVGLRVAHGR